MEIDMDPESVGYSMYGPRRENWQITGSELAMLRASATLDEWESAIKKICLAHQAWFPASKQYPDPKFRPCYPIDWWRAVHESGLAAEVFARFRRD